ncbi:cell division protein FtsX [uncultured Sphingomonas sp.]|uniref:cell division protein FtsX n=1 Tax=uncultured Sphingomonas sp. TaxID=158754 RepID=UPI003748F2F6
MSAATARILDTARDGRVMAAVLAIMLFLAVLATAGGIATASAGRALGAALHNQATVQIVAADIALRDRLASRMLAVLRTSPAIVMAAPVPRAELTRLLGPWLGEAASEGDLPVPALIDVTLAARADAAAQVRAAMATVTPLARLDTRESALAATSTFLTTVTALAAVTVALVVAAGVAVVLLAVRTGLSAHRATIAVMHGLGASDTQIARLFRRRIARDAGLGAAIGGPAGWGMVAVLGHVATGPGSQLLDGARLGQAGWIAIVLLPGLFVLFAALVAYRAVVRALARLA